MTAVSRSSSLACEVLHGPWKSCERFGKKSKVEVAVDLLLGFGGITHNHPYMVRIRIEEEYAKKLAKLAKFSLGRDEIG